MRKKRNRKRGQNSSESASNMSVASTVDFSHDHSAGGVDYKEQSRPKAMPKSNAKSKPCTHENHAQSCRPKDPNVLKANIQQFAQANRVLHNGCCDTNHHHHGHGISTISSPSEMKTEDSGLYDKANAESQTIESDYACCNSCNHGSKSFHQRLETPTSKSNSDVNEPISELTKLVDDIEIQNDFVTRGTHLQEDLIKGGEEDEILEEFGAAGSSSQLLENDDPSVEELPSSLSDFVLGYRNDSYPIPPVPPNDDDIDIIKVEGSEHDITLVPYESELQMPDIMRLITKDLSEPYSIYTYRYFIHNWPQLCFLAMYGSTCVGAIVCKLDVHKKMARRGYIAMLAVDENHRKRKIGSSLVRKAIRAMVRGDCDEVVLETEITNRPALRLYENLGFVRDKRLFRYYLNGVDALRLKLWLR